MTEEQSPGGGREPLTAAEWLLLFVLASVSFTHVVDLIIVQPLGPQYREVLHITPQAFGVLVAAYGFTAGVSGLFSAMFLQRFDRKRALLVMYAGFTASTLLCSAAGDYWVLLLARSMAGGFGGVVGATVLAIVGDVIPYSRRGRAMGFVMLAFSAAMIAGVPAGLVLANRFGWWAPFVGLGALSTTVWIAAAFILPPVRTHLAGPGATARTPREALRELWQVIVEPNHLRGYALMLALVLGVAMIFPYITLYMVGNVGLKMTDLPYIYVCGGLTTLFTVPFFGWLSDRLGKLPVFRVMATLTVIPILATTNLPPAPLAVAILVSTLFMVTSSARMVPAQALITACAEPRRRGSFLSVVASVQQIGAGAATVVGGLIIGKAAEGGESLNLGAEGAAEPIANYPWVGLVSAAFTLLSVVVAGYLRPITRGAVTVDETVQPTAAAAPEEVARPT